MTILTWPDQSCGLLTKTYKYTDVEHIDL